MKKIKVVIFLSALICSGIGKTQNEFSKWYFGINAGLDFSTSPPTPLSNGMITNNGGCGSVCDNVGNLLFYTDGTGVINSAQAIMANGTGLNQGNNAPGLQSGLIIKQPGNTNLYYIFTVPALGNSNIAACYNIVDMSLAAGLGSVTVKNFTLFGPACDKLVPVRHCNGRDVWIVCHDSNNFRAYLLTSGGLNLTPINSTVGETYSIPGPAATGEMKVSPDGKKLAVATSSNSVPPATGQGGFCIFDFDASSGIVSNSLALMSYSPAYGNPRGVEFSPDGTKLYGTSFTSTNPSVSRVYQWNVCASSPSAIISSLYTFSVQNIANSVMSSIQRAIDGKIYIAVSGHQSLTVINNPNASGAAMNFVYDGQSIVPKMCGNGLPNFINPYIKPAPAPFAKSVNCHSVTFTVPPVPTFSSGCQASPYPPSGYQWNFGDPGSGAANSSSLASPVHSYSALGTYSVSLILFNPCSNDTLTQSIAVSAFGPTPAVSGNTMFCNGDHYTFTVSGGSSYSWSNGATTATTALSPSQTSVFTVSATLNGCTQAKTFTVNVNPCAGISAIEGTSIRLYPNPVSGFLNIESDQAGELTIIDLSGRVVLQKELSQGTTTIDAQCLPAGVYIAEMQGWRGRIVKIENP